MVSILSISLNLTKFVLISIKLPVPFVVEYCEDEPFEDVLLEDVLLEDVLLEDELFEDELLVEINSKVNEVIY